MARQQQAQANQLYGASQGLAGQGQGEENSTYATLFPTYSKMARGEATPGSVAANTAAQQSIGGATAGLTGRAEQEAARTGNAAGEAAGIGKAMRAGGKQLSTLAMQNKAQEAQQGLRGLMGLHQSGAQQQEAGLGDESQAIKDNLAAQQTGWFQNMMAPINDAAKVAAAYYGGG